MKRNWFASALSTFILVGVSASPALASAVTFTTLDYDNTANVVNAGPTPVNNQTTGYFRDLYWWSINNGAPRVGSGDYINQGNQLVLQSNHAVPGASGPTSLNFTGPSVSGGQAYVALYDTTPGDGSATDNLFNFGAAGGVTISQDVLFVKHNSSVGIVTMFNDGEDGLALLANNRDGNNTDFSKLSLIYKNAGTGIQLASTNLPFTAFESNEWYRMTMNVAVVGDTWTVNGFFYNHQNTADPNSALAGLITSLTFSGSMSDPDSSARVLSSPGQVGIIALGNESISLPDNVGVSVTNFDLPGDFTVTATTPEPGSLFLLGSGMLAAARYARRRRA